MGEGFDWGGLVKAVAPAVIGLGTSLITNNQAVQQAKGQANAQQRALDAQYAIALQNEKNIKAMEQMNKAPLPKKSNTALYVGLGVGGALVLGLLVFAVTRK